MRKLNLKGIVASIMVLIAVLGLNQTLDAQMHRPILEDVFTLYNLLHRDYSEIEESEIRQKALENDRTTVITIIKNYVADNVSVPSCDNVKDSLDYSSIQRMANNIVDNYQQQTGLTSGFFQKIGLDLKTKEPTFENACLGISCFTSAKGKLTALEKQLLKVVEGNDISEEPGKTYKMALDTIQSIIYNMDASSAKWKLRSDRNTLEYFRKKFQKRDDGAIDSYENQLLEGVVLGFWKKYDCGNFPNDEVAKRIGDIVESNSPTILFSGQKAAFGLPGIAGSAPMMVDVINEVLMEEIKAELATAVFKLLKEQLLDAKDGLRIKEGKATRSFTLTLKNQGDSISWNGSTKKFDPNNKDLKYHIKQEDRIIVFSAQHKGSNISRVADGLSILSTLFPKTKNLIEDVASQDLYQLIDLLKESIRSDLKDLLKNLALIDEIDWIKNEKSEHQEVAIAFEGIDIMNQFASMRHPVEIFSILPESEIVSRVSDSVGNKNLLSVLRLQELFAYSLTLEDQGTRAWVSTGALEPFLDQPDFYALFFGCLLGLDNKYPEYRIRLYHGKGSDKAKMGDSTRVIKRISQEVKDRLDNKKFIQLRGLFYQFSLAGNYVNDQLLSIKQLKSKGDTPDYQKFASLSESVTSIIDTTMWMVGATMKELGLKELGAAGTVMDRIKYLTTTMRAATNIYQALGEKQYVLAVGNSMNLVENILCDGGGDRKVCEALTKGDWQRTANFLVSIAIAEDRDDLEAAMRQFAHNPGNWRVKRESKWNVSLAVYGGGFFGQEHFTKDTFQIQTTYRFTDSLGETTSRDTLMNMALTSKNRTKRTAAFMLCIGPSLSKGFDLFKERSSISLFLPMIDIGAVTALRISDPNAGDLPTFQWRDIFAPGAYIYWGLPTVPISIGFGGQYSSALREIKFVSANTINTTFASSIRYGFGVGVDLSLLNFHTSLGKRKGN